MTGEVTDLMEELCFILTKSNFLRCKIYNSFSHKVELFSYSGCTCFTDPLSDWVECESLGRRSIYSPTDRWLRIASGRLIELMYISK